MAGAGRGGGRGPGRNWPTALSSTARGWGGGAILAASEKRAAAYWKSLEVFCLMPEVRAQVFCLMRLVSSAIWL